ncbi:MAG: sterol desaturase family protein [Rhodospirillales bacterium]|jgi:sterol desaturase/sphingolipid hydroxylase (fatty acid hydroxylase superfamily)|nr:sterol desaturase family protein [Rhodospirillales bacterium]MBT4041812.1 sterol desaturase family protein [Rhodospirillales bacterium]MBT4628458.1 sterol desaturase family protein [Rhodospirillales bacterium]MBT5353416.1 sterol desaturase family protein [Rhodospirillales bacterium]MBT5519220.1 sterol desaturase family protein [Rhodospirillales bacterium]
MEIPEVIGTEAVIRGLAFLGVLLIMVVWELMAPRRPLTRPRGERWVVNILIIAVNTMIARFMFPAMALSAAFLAEDNGWGLLHMVGAPASIAFVVSLLCLDLAIYIQHVVFHHVPVLWRLHRVHHMDLDMDVTTGLRFHPIEIILSLLIKAGVIIAIGADATAVVLFVIILNASSMFNHSNIRLPKIIDTILRAAVVTPDMHRVHHSTIRSETDSNFGFFLSIWDRMFKTYQAQPKAGHLDMEIGQSSVRDPRALSLPALLVQPFRKLD